MTDTPADKVKLKVRPEDVESPDAIIKAVYDIISGPAGERNWPRLRTLYIEGARLIPTGKRMHDDGGFQVLSVDEWIADASGFLNENDFWEKEIMRHSDQFGNMIHAFSTSEARDREDGQPIARGINSIQLLYKDKRWWIVTVMWANENEDNPIPREFLPYLW